MLLGDSIIIWNFIVLTVVFFNIEAREGVKQYLFRIILNTYHRGLNNKDVYRSPALIDVKNNNITAHSTVNLRQVGRNYTPTIILKTEISRIRRETPDNEAINPDIINGSHFLKCVPDKKNRDAFAYIFNICSYIHICKQTVVPDVYPVDYVGGCCLQCDCSPTCHERRSCCPTIEPVDKPEVVDNAASSCQYPVLFANQSNPSEYIGETAEFSFVRSCPKESDTQTTITCEQPYMGPGYSMIDLLPVTDDDNTVNFGNRHCAKCNHRTQNLHVWLPQVRCRLLLNVLSIPELAEEVRVREDCYIEFKPPDTVDVNSTRCFSNVINQCNTTGQWSGYDSVLERACDTIETLYTVPYTNKRYANIFCAICNGETITLPRKYVCPEHTNELETSFTLLLAYTLDKETNHSINKCEMAKLNDPIKNMCEKVHCSYPLRLNSYTMKCVDGLQFTSEGRIIVHMRVVYNVPVQISDVQLISTLIQEILNTNQVFICKMMIYSKTELVAWKWQILLETQTRDIIVTENLIIFELKPVHDVKLPFAILNDIKASMTFQHYDSMNNLIFETMVGTLDTWMPFTDNERPDFIDERPEKRNANGEFVYEDPYSKHVVIGHMDLSFDYCYHAGSPVLFAEDFMECATFLYDITQHGIKRYPRGLLLSSMNVTFEFGTFQSKNESHVCICTDSVISLVAYSACSLV